MFETLKRVFEPDEESYDLRPQGKSAVAAFLVDADGLGLLDSEVLSSCAWGLGQVLRDKDNMRDWLALFQDTARGFSAGWRGIVAEESPDDDVEPDRFVLDHELLRECLDAAVHRTGVAEAFGPATSGRSPPTTGAGAPAGSVRRRSNSPTVLPPGGSCCARP